MVKKQLPAAHEKVAFGRCCLWAIRTQLIRFAGQLEFLGDLLIHNEKIPRAPFPGCQHPWCCRPIPVTPCAIRRSPDAHLKPWQAVLPLMEWDVTQTCGERKARGSTSRCRTPAVTASGFLLRDGKEMAGPRKAAMNTHRGGKETRKLNKCFTRLFPKVCHAPAPSPSQGVIGAVYTQHEHVQQQLAGRPLRQEESC
jgi:hypothetical protein